MATLSFQADEVGLEEPRKYDPIPEGLYKAVIIDSEMKPTKTGTGNYLQLKFEVMDSQYAGKWIFTRLNLDNPNQTAVDIAQRDLSSICRAVGKSAIGDSEELHMKPMMIKVAIQPADAKYDASNVIKAYSPADALQAVATPAAAPSSAPAATPEPAPAAAGKKPWE